CCLVRVCRCFFFSSRRRHTRFSRDWSSDVCSSDLEALEQAAQALELNGWGEECLQSLEAALARCADDGVTAAVLGQLRDALRDRSEERRVGKECNGRGTGAHDTEVGT